MRRLVLALSLACSCAGGDARPEPDDAPQLRRRPLTRAELPTTSGALFVRNLEAELAEAEAEASAPPADAAALRRLGAVRYRAGRYHGDIDRIASAVAAFDAAIALTPDDGELYVLRAKAEASLHRFDAARADLARAEARGISHTRQGAMHLVGLATQAATRGDIDAMEAAFESAEDAIRDPDPMFVAWLYTQRGAALMDVEPQRAVEFLAAAVDRLPGFVLAEEHLAEALHRVGRDDEAIAIYERVIARTDDPEFMGALAEIHAAHGRRALAQAWTKRARTRFETLLARHPEAMSWHAAAFFQGPGGDAARARALLRDNARLRPTPEALVALARAELDAMI